MRVELWSFGKLDLSLRSSFELPAYPNSDYHSEFEDYMRSLGVFRFTCTDTEVCPNPLIIKRQEEKPLQLPFDCYFNSCAISDDELSIIEWPMDDPAGESLHRTLMEHPIAKDNKAWFNWNVKMSVKKLQWEFIETEVVDGASESLVANKKLETL